MERFNLLDEPWIAVVNTAGQVEEVSLKEVFAHAHEYKDLCGDMRTQDFAVLRVLLAVLHTVFSRFDVNGQCYEAVEVDGRLRQINEIDEDDKDDYVDALIETWTSLHSRGQFPNIIDTYLEAWRDRFFLFHDVYPFFQVTKDDIVPEKIYKGKAGPVAGKTINRLISESGNKIALFSPKEDNQKNLLTESELIRWVITYQGYSGTADKAIFGKEKYKASKGWLFDIGGIYLKGKNLFETLLLNWLPDYDEKNNLFHKQTPCWEMTSAEIIQSYFLGTYINNIASLYTAWSRGVYIDSNTDTGKDFTFLVVKLPDINHQDQFLEPMTLWHYNENGENKGKYTPRKHQANKSVWRSFGLLTSSYDSSAGEKKNIPGIMEWHKDHSKKLHLPKYKITICAISMQDDGNATSWVPTDEIVDYLTIDNFVMTDVADNGWIVRINEMVEQTKDVIEGTYKKYLKDIEEIRNKEIETIRKNEKKKNKSTFPNTFVSQRVEDLYFQIDEDFRRWIVGIECDDEKDGKVCEWQAQLKKTVWREAKQLLEQGSPRDYTGITVDEKVKNIATAYNSFSYFLNKQLPTKEGE